VVSILIYFYKIFVNIQRISKILSLLKIAATVLPSSFDSVPA